MTADLDDAKRIIQTYFFNVMKGNHGRNDTLRTPQQKHQSKVRDSQNKGAPSALAGKRTGHI